MRDHPETGQHRGGFEIERGGQEVDADIRSVGKESGVVFLTQPRPGGKHLELSRRLGCLPVGGGPTGGQLFRAVRLELHRIRPSRSGLQDVLLGDVHRVVVMHPGFRYHEGGMAGADRPRSRSVRLGASVDSALFLSRRRSGSLATPDSRCEAIPHAPVLAIELGHRPIRGGIDVDAGLAIQFDELDRFMYPRARADDVPEARTDQAARLRQRPRQPLPVDTFLEERARDPRFIELPAQMRVVPHRHHTAGALGQKSQSLFDGAGGKKGTCRLDGEQHV